MFKTKFSGHIKIWGTQKYLGGTAPNAPPWLRVCSNLCTRDISLFLQGTIDRRS